jgi:hypothetical protein
MFSGTVQFSHQVCQFFCCRQSCISSCACAIVVLAGKLRKLWDSLSELCSSLCERRLERAFPRHALLPVENEQFTQFSLSMMSHSKIAQFNWGCIAPHTRLSYATINFCRRLVSLVGRCRVRKGQMTCSNWAGTSWDWRLPSLRDMPL